MVKAEDITRLFPSVPADEHAVFLFETYSPQLLRRRAAAPVLVGKTVTRTAQQGTHILLPSGAMLLLRKQDAEFLKRYAPVERAIK